MPWLVTDEALAVKLFRVTFLRAFPNVLMFSVIRPFKLFHHTSFRNKVLISNFLFITAVVFFNPQSYNFLQVLFSSVHAFKLFSR